MEFSLKLWVAALLVVSFGGVGLAHAQLGSRVEDWVAPEHASRSADLTDPVTFVGVTPCRIVDTRDPVGPYGGPILAPNAVRDFDLNASPVCTGIPVEVEAYSLNFTVTQTQGPGDLRVWPSGQTPPLVSTLNYLGGQTIANAAIVPAGSNDAISVIAAVSGTHLIIDINGYFTDRPNQGNSFEFRIVAPTISAFSVYNDATVASGSHGLFAATSSAGNSSFGVFGWNFSGSSAEIVGVMGRSGMFFGPPLYGPAGVRGESINSFGVLGVSQANTALAVAGSNVSGGTEQSWGGLGCSNTTAVCGSGNLSISGSKSFVEPHPTDASKVIKYVSLEGNEAGTYFGGRGKFERGIAKIPVPESFRMVTAEDGLRVQVTPIGELATVAVVKLGLDEIVVKGSRNVEFFYTVNGLRKGYEDFTPIVEEGFFVPRSADYRMPAALSPEAKRKLIANGTYNEDGTVNMETAERLGWTARWKDRSDTLPTEQEGKK